MLKEPAYYARSEHKVSPQSPYKGDDPVKATTIRCLACLYKNKVKQPSIIIGRTERKAKCLKAASQR
jgi:hypothetical protein